MSILAVLLGSDTDWPRSIAYFLSSHARVIPRSRWSRQCRSRRVQQLLTERLGSPIEMQLSSSSISDLDSRSQPVKLGLGGSLADLAGWMEWNSLRSGWFESCPWTRGIRDSALAAGRTPIDDLEARGRLDASGAAELRARSLGLPLAPAGEWQAIARPGWLPADLISRAVVRLVEYADDQMIVTAPRPTARLARELSTLFPDAAIAWRVSPALKSVQDFDVSTDELSARESTREVPGVL